MTDSGSGVVTPVSANALFKVTVRAANAAPQLAPVGNQSVAEGGDLAFTLRGGDTITTA